MARILLVDDDSASLDSTRKILEWNEHEVTVALDGQEALEKTRQAAAGLFPMWDLVVSDVRMPRLTGLEFLKALAAMKLKMPVVLMTAYGQIDEAVLAMKSGAVDFLTKPFRKQALIQAVELAFQRSLAQTPADSPLKAGDLMGSSPALMELQNQIKQVAPTDATVLITGPSGSGKERVARALHEQSRVRDGAFVALNCAAIPENLIEAELFGFEKGSFSGAMESKRGLFEVADQGTLFLDEIGDMPLSLQTSLLRVLQEREVRRIGATQSRKINVRVISATHRDLASEVLSGRFREDLLFRLEVVGLKVPALSERTEDLPYLALQFVRESSLRHQRSVQGIESEALACLLQYPWPGNVRELQNVIERAVIFAPGSEITLADLPEHLSAHAGEGHHAPSHIRVPIGMPLREVEDLLIRKTLEATAGDKNMAAKLLGVNSRTIYRKLEKPTEDPKETPTEADNTPAE